MPALRSAGPKPTMFIPVWAAVFAEQRELVIRTTGSVFANLPRCCGGEISRARSGDSATQHPHAPTRLWMKAILAGTTGRHAFLDSLAFLRCWLSAVGPLRRHCLHCTRRTALRSAFASANRAAPPLICFMAGAPGP